MLLSRRTFVAASTAGLASLAAAPLAGCGLFDKHVDILLIGDSIMNQTAAQVKPQLRAQKGLDDVSTFAKGVNGTGLLTPKLFDWQEEGRALVNQYRPAITVVLFVGNYTETDLFIGADGTEVPDDYSKKFYDEWGRQAEILTRTLQSANTIVYWVLPPPFIGDEGKRREGLLRDTYVQLAQRIPGVGLIDGRQALADAKGDFTWNLPGADGKPVQVRAADSVHLTEAGGERMAREIAFAIGPRLLDIRRQNAR